MLSPARLEAYQRRATAKQYEVVELPPFVLFFNPNDPLRFFNYAHPLEPVSGDLCGPLTGLRAAFAARDRMARFEFIEEYAPGLAPALRAAGFIEEGRYPLMVCTPETFIAPPTRPDLEIVPLSINSPEPELRSCIDVQRKAYGESAGLGASHEDAENFRQGIRAGNHIFLARWRGVPASTGGYMPPLDKLTEIAGIGTLPEYRRMGLASALTAYAVEDAFRNGVEAAFLTAADERAGRVYERIGFRPYATGLAYSDGNDY